MRCMAFLLLLLVVFVHLNAHSAELNELIKQKLNGVTTCAVDGDCNSRYNTCCGGVCCETIVRLGGTVPFQTCLQVQDQPICFN